MTSGNAIVVLGNRLKSENIHSELKGRMEVAIALRRRLLNNQNNIKIFMILSGGVSNHDVPLSEAEVMRRYCIANGVPDDEAILEPRSLDTVGNALFTRRIVDSIKSVDTIYVVSSCYHTERIKYIFGMSYGDKYDLNFDHCHLSENPKPPEKERASLARARDFFAEILPGDAAAIEEKLFSEHDLYKTKS